MLNVTKSKTLKGFVIALMAGSVLATGVVVQGYADDGDRGQRMERSERGGGFRAGERFARADTDGSRTLTLEEFQAPQSARFANADANGDGQLTLDEMVAARQDAQRDRVERAAGRMLERVDADGDGTISVEEMQASSAELFARLDRNEDGELEPREVRRGMRGGPDGPRDGRDRDDR